MTSAVLLDLVCKIPHDFGWMHPVIKAIRILCNILLHYVHYLTYVGFLIFLLSSRGCPDVFRFGSPDISMQSFFFADAVSFYFLYQVHLFQKELSYQLESISLRKTSIASHTAGFNCKIILREMKNVLLVIMILLSSTLH